jgi:hypothetical protein
MNTKFGNFGRVIRAYAAAALVISGAAMLTVQGAAAAKGPLDRTVTIVNGRDSTLTYLFASNVNEQYWGPDHLGRTVLKAGERITIDFADGTEECVFDMQVKFMDGTITEQRGVDLCVEETITFS